MPAPEDENLLVGYNTADDAAVYSLGNGHCLVQTVDFFTPIVDDPATFGAISAANSLSDVYAMGGRPVTALSLVCFPYKTWPKSILGEILAGAAAKVKEAGAVICGGHSVQDAEIKFGLSVTGMVEQSKIWTNHRPTPDHKLVLTKPLGTGTLTTAAKRDALPLSILDEAIAEMQRLNRRACELALDSHVSAATDITGFGLMGHLFEMVRGNQLGAVIDCQRIPVLNGAWDAIELEAFTGAHRTNRDYTADYHIPQTEALERYGQVVYDPQTSGGLLLALPEDSALDLVSALNNEGHRSAIIGQIIDRPTIELQ